MSVATATTSTVKSRTASLNAVLPYLAQAAVDQGMPQPPANPAGMREKSGIARSRPAFRQATAQVKYRGYSYWASDLPRLDPG